MYIDIIYYTYINNSFIILGRMILVPPRSYCVFGVAIFFKNRGVSFCLNYHKLLIINEI